MTKLSINLNKIALLRNQRSLPYPDICALGKQILQSQAHGLTGHPRPDERHMLASDLAQLKKVIAAYPDRELNIEGSPQENLLPILENIRPHQATFVPDDPKQSTSDHGWELNLQNVKKLEKWVSKAHDFGCRVSLFMDAMPKGLEAVIDTGADRIELYTGPYAMAHLAGNHKQVLPIYQETAEKALQLGLAVNAGHDLSQNNLAVFLDNMPKLSEISIGHAFTAEALWQGVAKTTEAYLAIISSCRVRHSS